MRNGHKEARIYNITHFVTKAHMFIMVRLVIHTIYQEMHVQQDAVGYFYISSFMVEEHTFKSHDISYLGKMRPFV